MAETPKNETTKSQSNQIEEFKKHPLWKDFREAYMKHSEVYPEDSAVKAIVVHNWNMFIAGAEAERNKKK